MEICNYCGQPIKKKRLNRTDLQNRSLHLWFTLLADALNEAGFDIRKTIREGLEISWTPENVKELLWRPVMKTLVLKGSTTQ